MSMEALLLATAGRVREVCDYTPAECDVEPDGKVPPSAGQVYVSVHPGAFNNDDSNALSLDESLDVHVTLTMKSGWMPSDRHGTEMITKARTGLYARAEAIRAALHMSYTVMNDANAGKPYSIGTAENGFVEPLRFRGCSAPMEKGPDWFLSEDNPNPPAGWALELRFGGARRVQVIEEQS